MTVLVVTNDFPPVVGGIETFTHSLVSRLPHHDVVVLTRDVPGARDVDSRLGVPVIRVPQSPLLPGPRLARWVSDAVRTTGARAVWFPSAAPLALLARVVRRAGAETVVASTHGHEVWWSRVPMTRAVVRRIATDVDALTYVSEFARAEIARALPPAVAARLVRLAPGVDTRTFAPDPLARQRIRSRLGVDDAPIVLAMSRLVTRKGHDRLLVAWPIIRRRHPNARLVIVGDGPRRGAVTALARACGGEAGGVHLVGPMPWDETPAWYAAADVFALVPRTRWGGLEPEALGICFLEAAAAGLPVVAGRGGGVAEAVVSGVTGVVVDGRSVAAIATAVSALVDSPTLGAAQGAAGRAWVAQQWSWDDSAEVLSGLLRG